MSSWSTNAKSSTQRRFGRASPLVTKLARAGYAAQGVLYGTIGALAVLVAARSAGVSDSGSGRITTQRGALAEIGAQPFGKILLVLMAVGLAGYAIWRFVQAAWNPEREAPPGMKGTAKRAGWFGVALVHASLVVFALRAAFEGNGGSEDNAKPLTAKLMAWQPLGPILVAAIGVGLFAYAAHEVWRAWKAKLDRELDLSALRPKTARIVVGLSRFGIAARGVVFSVMGIFLVVAAFTTNPAEARGFGQALATLQGWTFGTILLGGVALGLVSYGLYDLVEARYRRIHPA
jgi:hypothetical protein